MKKQLLISLVIFFGCTAIYASFPVTENVNSTEISLTSEGPDISKSEKIVWFALGLVLNFYALGASMIYQLITKKKGPIKYALFGFLSLLIIVLLFLMAIFGEFDNPFIFS